MYIAGALQTFTKLGAQKRQVIALEIAVLGRSGLDINDTEDKYTPKALPGKFSGLHLLAIMYTAFRQIVTAEGRFRSALTSASTRAPCWTRRTEWSVASPV